MNIVFEAQQEAVNIVNTSPHPKNRIAAAIFHMEKKWLYPDVNQWPAAIDDMLGRNQRVGSVSGTIHAETACIYKAAFTHKHAVEGASIAITDPPCPNCVKNMAEAGIDNIYIDHKGFQKDFAQRRMEDFDSLSIRLAEKAGISMYEVHRKEQLIKPITIANKDYVPYDERPVEFNKEDDFKNFNTLKNKNQKAAYCFAMDKDKKIQIFCTSHPALGFRRKNDLKEITHPQTKYSYIQEACNRLIMNAARHGYEIINSEIFVNEVPTSREFVNIVGAGIKNINIMRNNEPSTQDSLDAMSLLKANNILNITE